MKLLLALTCVSMMMATSASAMIGMLNYSRAQANNPAPSQQNCEATERRGLDHDANGDPIDLAGSGNGTQLDPNASSGTHNP